jgi:hypothetical protein
MVNLQQLLLSLLPVIGDRPAPVFLAPAFAAVSNDGGIDDFVAKWWNQRDGAPGSVHDLGDKKIEVMWHVFLIFLDGILAQKMLIYITADTL